MDNIDRRPIHFQVTEGVPYSPCGLAGAQLCYSRNSDEVTCFDCLQLIHQEEMD